MNNKVKNFWLVERVDDTGSSAVLRNYETKQRDGEEVKNFIDGIFYVILACSLPTSLRAFLSHFTTDKFIMR